MSRHNLILKNKKFHRLSLISIDCSETEKCGFALYTFNNCRHLDVYWSGAFLSGPESEFLSMTFRYMRVGLIKK